MIDNLEEINNNYNYNFNNNNNKYNKNNIGTAGQPLKTCQQI